MKRVILMRHSKSSWDHDGLTDHERPLNGRGKRDAPVMAKRIQDEGLVPDIIYSSDSQRTKETYDRICSVWGDVDVEFVRELYHASPAAILRTIKRADPRCDTILIIAHNPGITYAYKTLAGVHVDNVPTSGLGLFTFKTDRFADIKEGSGKLSYFSYPKKKD